MTQLDILSMAKDTCFQIMEVTDARDRSETTVLLEVTGGERPGSYIIDKTFLEESISLVMSAPMLPEPGEHPIEHKTRMAKLTNKIKTMFAKKKRVVRYSLR